ncbi:MAG: TIGR02147 family protein [Pseudobdellovibrionaceae bacterium]
MAKSIFQYDNYRVFLKDYYEWSKLENKNFSFRFFSRALGYSSPNFLKCVIDGTRNLTTDGVRRFIKALKLNKEEAAFFENLVSYNQAKNEEEKRIYAEHILHSKAYRKMLPLREAQFSYFANWYLIPIRELVNLPNFQEDPEWIAQSLVPSITPAQAKQAFEELLQLGLIERDHSGKVVQTTANVTTPDEIISTFKADCLKEFIKLGAESIKRVPRDKRDISSVTIGLSKSSFLEVKEIAKKFRREIMEIASKEQDSSDDIYQFNIQFFPLTETSYKEKK